LTLKAEWEAALGIPVSGPEDFVFEAGSSESQERVLNAAGKIGVWVDTVGSLSFQTLGEILMSSITQL
jgi:N-acetylated-alpha-linked acidic dipeptidase